MEEVCTICSVVSWNAEDFFFFSPSMWEEVTVMSYAGKSTNLGHVWLSLSLSFFDGLWTIDRLSILPMTYQRFSPSSFPFPLDGDLDSP